MSYREHPSQRMKVLGVGAQNRKWVPSRVFCEKWAGGKLAAIVFSGTPNRRKPEECLESGRMRRSRSAGEVLTSRKRREKPVVRNGPPEIFSQGTYGREYSPNVLRLRDRTKVQWKALGLRGQRLPELNLVAIRVIDPGKATVGFIHPFRVNLDSFLL